MRSYLLIPVGVALYSLLEAALLFSIVVGGPFGTGETTNRFPGLAALAQLLLIPGAACLFSGFAYGKRGYIRRAFLIFLLIWSPALSLFLPALLLESLGATQFVLPWVGPALALLLLILGLVAFFFVARAAARDSVKQEERRWLADRRLNLGFSERKKRNRAFRVALFLPTLTVLLVFLFLPQIWRCLSHLNRRPSQALIRYRIRVPITCVIFGRWQVPETGEASISGIGTNESDLKLLKCCRPGPQVFEWGLSVEPYSGWSKDKLESRGRSPCNAVPVGRRELQIDEELLTCREFALDLPSSESNLKKTNLLVICDGTGRLHARFAGEWRELQDFYEMIRNLTPENQPNATQGQN